MSSRNKSTTAPLLPSAQTASRWWAERLTGRGTDDDPTMAQVARFEAILARKLTDEIVFISRMAESSGRKDWVFSIKLEFDYQPSGTLLEALGEAEIRSWPWLPADTIMHVYPDRVSVGDLNHKNLQDVPLLVPASTGE